MFRALLSRSGVAYVKECNSEMNDPDEFIELLEEYANGGDVIALFGDLEELEDALKKDYIIEVL